MRYGFCPCWPDGAGPFSERDFVLLIRLSKFITPLKDPGIADKAMPGSLTQVFSLIRILDIRACVNRGYISASHLPPWYDISIKLRRLFMITRILLDKLTRDADDRQNSKQPKDISEISVDLSQSVEKRKLQYLMDIQNPYRVRHEQIQLRIKYAPDGPSINKILAGYFENEKY